LADITEYNMYLVTGGTGFIGSHLVEYLLERSKKAKVVVLARGEDGTSLETLYYLYRRFGERVRFFRSDIRDYNNVKEAVRGVEVVYHLAAQTNPDRSIKNPRETFDVNIGGTINLLEACLQSAYVERVVIQSTSEVYGEPQYIPIDEKHPLNSTHPYSASKIAAEKIAYSYFRTYGLPVVIARPFNAYGPRQRPPAVIPAFIERILKDEPIIVYGDGTQARDYVYVKDVVRGLYLLLEKGRPGEVYNFATGRAISIMEIAQRTSSLLKKELKVIYRPPRPAEPKLLTGSYEKANKELGWEPLYSFEEGLRETIKSYYQLL